RRKTPKCPAKRHPRDGSPRRHSQHRLAKRGCVNLRLATRALLCVAVTTVCSAFATACTRIGPEYQPHITTSNLWTIHGVLRTGSTQTPDNLNTMLGTLGPDIDLGSFWCARLLLFDDRETLQPELAMREPTLANNDISR